MADIRIKDLATTATTTASDDFMAVDGAINGTRKLSAATPAFLTSVTTPTLTAPAANNLTLAGGSTGASLVLGQGASGNLTASRTGNSAFVPSFSNTTSGSAASMSMSLVGGSKQSFIHQISEGFTTSGPYVAGSLVIQYPNPDNLIFTANVEAARLTTNRNLLIGTTSETGLTGAGGLRVAATTSAGSSITGSLVVGNLTAATTVGIGAGKVNIGDTTAGSSGAGALVVAGGISVGAGIDASSHFGGKLEITGEGSTNYGTSNPVLYLKRYTSPNGNFLVFQGRTAYTTYIGTIGTAAGIATTNDDLVIGVTGNAPTFAITASTGAATFAGAVTIGGNVGFYNASPVAKPTSVAVTAAAIHAALVTLNLIAA